MHNLRWLGVGAALAILILLVSWWRDPHHTRLPFGSTDLGAVQAQLARLTPEERALVESYVQRSHGDVLPARFADPDNPLTARTFGEAIVLERRWQAEFKKQQAVADARAAAREQELAPLRAVVGASVARRELMSPAQLSAQRSGDAVDHAGAKRALPSEAPSVFTVAIQLENLDDSDVVELTGMVSARDRDAYLPLQLCWVDIKEDQYVPVRGQREILCANPSRGLTAQMSAFIDDPPGRFTLVWEPRHIRLRNGTVLEAKAP